MGEQKGKRAERMGSPKEVREKIGKEERQYWKG